MEYLTILIGIVAALYASVGHGGASGYLALMAIVGFDIDFIKPTALVLNLIVSGIAFLQFYRNGFFRKNLIVPFLIGSIPAAFIGGSILVSPALFKLVLGLILILAVVRMTWNPTSGMVEGSPKVYVAVCIGVCIGFFSGLIGIGGGIVLSPILILLGWADAKTAACTSALFIWFNSLAGLFGFYSMGGVLSTSIAPILISAVIGAIIGGYMGSFKWNKMQVRYALSFVLAIAAFKLIIF